MAVDEKYSSIILKRIFESQNPPEQIELISDDNQRIPIHRVILTAASKYFAAPLGPNWNFQEGNRNEGEQLEGADGETLRTVVNYCYTGHIELTGDNVRTFQTIASRYQFDLLEEKCLSFYSEILSVTNSVEALMFAEEFSYAGLRQAALQFICEQFELVPTAEMQKLDHQLFQEILESDKIKSSEELIFDRLVKWSKYRNRKPFVPNLLKLIRLQHIKLETLNDTVETFYKRFDCTELMLVEYRRRASGNHFDGGFRRRRRHPSLFCLFTYGLEIPVIEVSRFNTELKNFNEICKLTIGKRIDTTMVINENKIYVLGGILGGVLNGVACNTVCSVDLSTRKKKILPSMNISRRGCTSILFGEYIYVFGGFNNDSGHLSSCERYDIKRKTWTEIESMNMARSDASAVVMDGCIYVAGGVNNHSYTSAFGSYDPMTNEWKELAPMNISRTRFALIQSNGFIYAIGGGDLNTIEKYDPSKNQWKKISHLVGSRSITSGFNVNGEIYVMNRQGEFRQIQIDESDNCSILPWALQTAYRFTYEEQFFLTLN